MHASVRDFLIPAGNVRLGGELHVGEASSGLVIFAHGSGSSRHSPRNQFVARVLRDIGLGTLLFDLMTAEEEQLEAQTRHLRFDIPFLAERLLAATEWVRDQLKTGEIGYFGSSTGAAAALVAAAELGTAIRAVVSRGGRPDLAADALPRVTAPTLLIIGGEDDQVIQLNEAAYSRLFCEKAIRIIPGATHLFEEPGTLEQAANLAAQWFTTHLPRNR